MLFLFIGLQFLHFVKGHTLSEISESQLSKYVFHTQE